MIHFLFEARRCYDVKKVWIENLYTADEAQNLINHVSINAPIVIDG